jgi:hypothetical protein
MRNWLGQGRRLDRRATQIPPPMAATSGSRHSNEKMTMCHGLSAPMIRTIRSGRNRVLAVGWCRFTMLRAPAVPCKRDVVGSIPTGGVVVTVGAGG